MAAIDTVEGKVKYLSSWVQFDLTVADNDNRALVVATIIKEAGHSRAVVGVQWDSQGTPQALSEDIAKQQLWGTLISDYIRTQIWYLLDPKAGTYTLRATANGGADSLGMVAWSLYGIDQTGNPILAVAEDENSYETDWSFNMSGLSVGNILLAICARRRNQYTFTWDALTNRGNWYQGTGDAKQIVHIYAGDTIIDAASEAAGGDWSYPGTGHIVAYEIEAAGNETQVSPAEASVAAQAAIGGVQVPNHVYVSPTAAVVAAYAVSPTVLKTLVHMMAPYPNRLLVAPKRRKEFPWD